MEADRLVVSRDGDQVVGAAESVPVKMTLPGNVVEPTAAVIAVTVLPTHRRQGRLRAMMRYQNDELSARGDHLAVLTASEAGIYQRFGYGPATLASGYLFDKRDLLVRLDGTESGAVRFVDDRALEAFPGILTSHQASRAGEVSRPLVDWLHDAVLKGAAA